MNDRHEATSASAPPAGQLTPDLPAAGESRLHLSPVPLLLVLLLVLLPVSGWLFVYWLWQEDQDPQSLVRGMQEPGRRSWQRAYALSQLLRDPDQDDVKDDVDLCRALSVVLAEHNERAAQDPATADDQEHVQFRVFLCRALGAFRLQDGLPPLLDAAESSTRQHEVPVRTAALEAVAVLAGNIGPARIRADRRAVDVLLAASRADVSLPASLQTQPDLISSAAFALGVVGGDEATERLTELLGDLHPDVRYNAALGLARHGQPQALPVLLEMLDPQNNAAYQGEKTNAARMRKQTLVWSNAIRAAERLAFVAPSATRTDVIRTLQQLSAADLPHGIRLDAKAALLRLQRQQ